MQTIVYESGGKRIEPKYSKSIINVVSGIMVLIDFKS